MKLLEEPKRKSGGELGYNKEKVTEGWRKLHNEMVHNLSCSPNTIRVIKLRRLR
jgi:hypothetical protein